MIVFESVWKKYSKELFHPEAPAALQGVSFRLDEGETLGLIGANGAGKSTSIKLMMDFIRPDSGTIRVFDSSPMKPDLRAQIGYLPEVASFPSNLTLPDLIKFTASSCGLSKLEQEERIRGLLEELNLSHALNKKLRNYSKGMQQRANFVLALLNNPQLLILDEPMSGLDPIGRGLVIDLIRRLKNEGKSILFCSHILSDVDRLVDKLLVLHKGKVLFNGTPEEFITQKGGSNVEDAFLSFINNEKSGADVG